MGSQFSIIQLYYFKKRCMQSTWVEHEQNEGEKRLLDEMRADPLCEK